MSREQTLGKKGTFLLAHGLNVSPRAMEWIGSEVRARGFATVFTCLAGHSGVFHERSLASCARWQQDFCTAYGEARSRGGPLTVLGYSLGGLLSALAIAKGIVAAPEKLVLLAPAIGLRRWVRFFEPLTKILPGSLPLPSAIPPSYRAASFAAVSWYRVLFEFYHELWRLGGAGALRDLPVRIYLSDRDEFISVLELERWIKEADLGDAKISIIELQATISATPQHLLLEPGHFGAVRWPQWIDEICSGAEIT